METIILILQSLIAFIFIFSGINKFYFDAKTLVKKGQTGVDGLPTWLIKFIAVSEIFGAIGIILPSILGHHLILIPISAICLGGIMIPAALIHFKRNEPKNILINCIILIFCLIVSFFRM